MAPWMMRVPAPSDRNLVRVVLVLVPHVLTRPIKRRGTHRIDTVATHPVQDIGELVVMLGLVRSGPLQIVEYLWNIVRQAAG